MATPSAAENGVAKPAPGRSGWLLPREHGAYGQLLIPGLAALLLSFSRAGAWLAVSFALVFLLHESLLILMGQRGPRAALQDGRRARWQAALLSVAFVPTFAAALAGMNPAARWALLLPGGLAAIMLALIVMRQERTTAGELHAAAALSSGSVPILLAGGASLHAAAAFWLVWLVTLLAATLSVRGVIAWARRRQAGQLRAAALMAAAGMAVCGFLAHRLHLPAHLWVSLLPAGLLTLRFLQWPPAPRHLRRIGWAWMAASLIILLLLVTVARPG